MLLLILLHVAIGIDPDKHLDLQTLGWDKCTAAMEEAITSEKSEPIFKAAADKFQEVAATGEMISVTSSLTGEKVVVICESAADELDEAAATAELISSNGICISHK